MHINVQDILAEEVGYRRTFTITGERPSFESIQLTQDIEGEITISRVDAGLLVRGRIATQIELTCDRCLSTFNRPVRVELSQIYSEQPKPEEEEMPIEDGGLDMAPLIEQDILVSLPIKLICRPDCRGVENASAEYTSGKTGTQLQNQARITKGNKRGRT